MKIAAFSPKRAWLVLPIFFALLTAFTSSTRPDRPAQANNVVVTLRVNTSEIDKDNLSSACDFGQEEGISNEDFTIVVNVGDVITWEGVSSNAPETDVVDITKIKYVRGKNIFGKDLATSGRGKNQKVSGKVLSSTAVGGDYKYDISFTVTNNGVKRNGTFHIDPKIQAH